MEIPTLLIGIEGPVQAGPGMVIVRADSGFLGEVELAGFRVVVLGDRPILAEDPLALTTRLRNRRTIVVLCAEEAGPEDTVRWIQAGFDRVVRRSGLEGELQRIRGELAMRLVRPHLELCDWCPNPAPCPGSEQEGVLRRVPGLERAHSVKEWAAALGWSEGTLRRFCHDAFGECPRDVLFGYVKAVVAWGRRPGWTVEDLADLLGYSSAPSLCHAFRRRGLEIPPASAMDEKSKSQ